MMLFSIMLTIMVKLVSSCRSVQSPGSIVSYPMDACVGASSSSAEPFSFLFACQGAEAFVYSFKTGNCQGPYNSSSLDAVIQDAMYDCDAEPCAYVSVKTFTAAQCPTPNSTQLSEYALIPYISNDCQGVERWTCNGTAATYQLYTNTECCGAPIDVSVIHNITGSGISCFRSNAVSVTCSNVNAAPQPITTCMPSTINQISIEPTSTPTKGPTSRNQETARVDYHEEDIIKVILILIFIFCVCCCFCGALQYTECCGMGKQVFFKTVTTTKYPNGIVASTKYGGGAYWTLDCDKVNEKINETC